MSQSNLSAFLQKSVRALSTLGTKVSTSPGSIDPDGLCGAYSHKPFYNTSNHYGTTKVEKGFSVELAGNVDKENVGYTDHDLHQ